MVRRMAIETRARMFANSGAAAEAKEFYDVAADAYKAAADCEGNISSRVGYLNKAITNARRHNTLWSHTMADELAAERRKILRGGDIRDPLDTGMNFKGESLASAFTKVNEYMENGRYGKAAGLYMELAMHMRDVLQDLEFADDLGRNALSALSKLSIMEREAGIYDRAIDVCKDAIRYAENAGFADESARLKKQLVETSIFAANQVAPKHPEDGLEYCREAAIHVPGLLNDEIASKLMDAFLLVGDRFLASSKQNAKAAFIAGEELAIAIDAPERAAHFRSLVEQIEQQTDKSKI